MTAGTRAKAVMSDVKGTDVFTNDADTMMFLQADPFDRVLQDGDFVDVKLYIRKNRHGKTGMLRFRWQPQYHRYLTISNMEE
jgi:replicative DNA helicase